MHRIHRRPTLLACLLAFATHCAFAQVGPADTQADLVLSSGLEGGGYWNAGNRLQAAARDVGLVLQNTASVGSLDNLRDLTDQNSPVSLAFAQADAVRYFLDRSPAAAPAIRRLGDVGRECVFIISADNSHIKTIEDIADAPRMYMGISSASSGSMVTWNYMATLMPELRDATVDYGDAVEMLTELSHPLSNIEKAVMVVHDPEAHSAEIELVTANPHKYRFVKIDHDSFTREVPGAGAVYEAMKVKPAATGRGRGVDTLCVAGLLVANPNKLTLAQLAKLEQLAGGPWNAGATER